MRLLPSYDGGDVAIRRQFVVVNGRVFARSWTLKDESEDAGAEPDECYLLGEMGHKQVPDLAIEVEWSRLPKQGLPKHDK